MTGGGYINPATVVTSSPATNSSDHRANYGFNAKYKDSDPVPTGHTNFVWNPGNIHFDSTSYDAMSLVSYVALLRRMSPGLTWTPQRGSPWTSIEKSHDVGGPPSLLWSVWFQ